MECAKQGGGRLQKGGVKKSKVAQNNRRTPETHGFGGGNVREGYLGDDRGLDLQMGVRRSHRNSDWIDQLTLKEGPLGAR